MLADSPTTDDLVALLRQRGQRVTSQRLVILRELRRAARHLTAAEVCAAVRDDLPGTSPPTIYATLDLLVELGLARRLDVGLGVTLYDPRVDPHAHAVCRRCGAVEDVEARVDSTAVMRAAHADGFQVEHSDVLLTGICRRCTN
jgi:Fe2+ or Zn2+ uptake regulation protein